jgi:hypothetical protein
MGMVNRAPVPGDAYHYIHVHICRQCNRSYHCNCAVNREKIHLICIDCELGIYDKRIHGGPHRRGIRTTL